MFLHSIETGLINNTIRNRMRLLLRTPGVTDSELISELNLAVLEKSERNLKLRYGKKGQAKVTQVQTLPQVEKEKKESKSADPGLHEKILAELKTPMSEVSVLKGELNRKEMNPQGSRPPRRSRCGCGA